MNKTLLAGRTLLPSGQIVEAVITMQGGAITEVGLGLDPAADVTVKGTIVPGFIDLQLNGAYGYDFTRDGRTVADVAARLPATGATSFLATIITSPWEDYGPRLRDVKLAAQGAAGAHILGVHLEGPYLNPKRAGAHDPAFLRPIDVAEIVAWADPTIVRMVTLSPELPGALEAIRALRQRGIVVSAGHSAATYEEATAGFAAGIGWGTHLFNAMNPLGHRGPALAGALLVSDVPCGLIVDGIHVHREMVKLTYRLKGTRGITLITDAMEAMGMSPGVYRLADRDVVVDDETARLLDGTLAGSILTMDAAVRNMLAFTGCALADAVTMASALPAQILNLDQKGRIAVGYDADLTVLDEKLRVAQTWVGGRLVYEAASGVSG
jgi:N-acetylglucosamine-6-phosphate deacetylase